MVFVVSFHCFFRVPSGMDCMSSRCMSVMRCLFVLSCVIMFGRFAVMRNWGESQHIPFNAFVAPDHLHMNDWGYACVAKLLAAAISEAATRSITSAARAGH